MKILFMIGVEKMAILHDYNLMPPLYQNIYFTVRFYSGKDLHKYVSKIIRDIEKKQGSSNSVSQSELELIKSLREYKYNTTDIHPNYENFMNYVSKTKKSTNVATRKRINEVVISTDFIYAFSRQEVKKIKELFKTINVDEIMEETESLALAEQNRIATYQKEAPKRKRMGSEINRELAKIAPTIIEEVNNTKNFFTKLRFYKKKIGFFLTPHIGKDGEVLSEYLKRAMKSERLFIDFDDENENYFVCFSEHADLAFMDFLLKQRYLKSLEGLKLLGIPIHLIISNCKYKNVAISKPEWHEIRFNTYYESIKSSSFGITSQTGIYNEESIRYVINQLMKVTTFESELHLACYLHYNFQLPMRNYVNKRKDYFEKNNISLSTDEFNKKRDEIYQQLVSSGVAKVKWKNEVDLFKLVLKHYPDAIYQYRTEWLEKQSLDIFIPSLRTAIEYQGQQHYEPIEFFGGNEAFLYRQKLDELKMEKCKKNGVRLIYWDYQNVISKTNLNRKINQDQV